MLEQFELLVCSTFYKCIVFWENQLDVALAEFWQNRPKKSDFPQTYKLFFVFPITYFDTASLRNHKYISQ